MTTDSNNQRRQAAQRITLIGALVNGVLSLMKIVGGIVSGSAALIADGLHSLSDLATDFLVVALLGVSHKKPDSDHPWGHERFETLGGVFLALILITVAGLMAWNSLQLLFADELPKPPTAIALVFAGLSILANEVLFFYTLKVGKANRSNLIIANAWHHRTDSLSSVVVFLAIIGSILGIWWLDAVAAVLVALLIAKVGIDILMKNLAELVDTGLPAEQVSALKQVATEVEGVIDVHHFRTRLMGGKSFLEMHLQVATGLSASEGHFIGDLVSAKIKQQFDDIAYIIYHIDTFDDEEGPHYSQLTLPTRSQLQQSINQIFDQQLGWVPHYQMVLYYSPKTVMIDVQMLQEGQTQIPSSSQLAEQLQTLIKAQHPQVRHLKLWRAC